jgi:hypothetical protein
LQIETSQQLNAPWPPSLTLPNRRCQASTRIHRRTARCHLSRGRNLLAKTLIYRGIWPVILALQQVERLGSFLASNVSESLSINPIAARLVFIMGSPQGTVASHARWRTSAEHIVVEGQRPFQVGHFQMNVSDADFWMNRL